MRKLSAVLVLFATHAAAAGTQPVQDDPLLTDLVREALERNPDIRAAQEMVEEARSRPAQAQALPDPTLSVSYINEGLSPSLGSREFTILGFLWTQDLPYPGKRGLRGEILSLEADQAAQQVERARLSTVAAVRRAYYGLVHARDLLDLIDEQERTFRQIAAVARERYAVGQGVQQDVLRAQVEVTRIRQLRAEQEAELAVQLAELNRLLDRASDMPVETERHLDLRPLGREPAELLVEVGAISPEARSAELAVERDRIGVDLARKAFKPDFSLQGGYQNRGGLDGMWQIGVGIRLPIYRKKNESGLAEAEARLRASERRAHAVRLLLRQRTQERLARIRAAEETVELYAKGIVPQDRLSLEAALANYQAGRVPFLTVLEALTSLYGDQEAHLRLLAAHEELRTSLAEASLEAGPDGAMASSTNR
jgi:cobalt-zinc-cadmium efflux system outer membrane protein